jgi:hypothetical protein
MFSELNIRTVEHEGELYVNAMDLSGHLAHAAFTLYAELANETNEAMRMSGMGLVEGIRSVAVVILEGDASHRLNSIDTLDDLMNL